MPLRINQLFVPNTLELDELMLINNYIENIKLIRFDRIVECGLWMTHVIIAFD